MSTTTERGEQVYAYLAAHLNQPHTRSALLAAVGLNPGHGTDAAIRHAREMATAAGLHFPPAVPGNGYTYWVIDQPEDAIIPTRHMFKVAAGVEYRTAVGVEFMAANAAQFTHPRLRAVAIEGARVQADKARHAAAADAKLAGLFAEAEHILRYDPAAR